MKRTTGILAVAVVAALTAISVQPAAASIIHYANVSSGSGASLVTISQITETNSTGSGTFNFGDAGAPSYYGQPELAGTTLTFVNQANAANRPSLPFAVNATTSTSDDLTAKLEFQVTAASGLNPSAFLNEFGDFSGFGTGFANVSQFVFITDTSGNVVASGTGTDTPAGPFVTTNQPTVLTWTGVAGAGEPGDLTTFDVIIDNDLVAGAPLPASSASLEKKGLSITIGQGPGTRNVTPEPASLSLLGAGAVALIARRRKA
jgi:hypothetical protein